MRVTQEVRELKEGSKVPSEWRERLESVKWRRVAVLLYLFTAHFYYPFKDYYRRVYGPPSGRPSQLEKTTTSPRHGAEFASCCTDQQARDARRVADAPGCEQSWSWQGFPRVSRWLHWFRSASTIYLAYVGIKCILPGTLEIILRSLNLSKPPNCYLLGRFLVPGHLRRPAALLFSANLFVWRLTQQYLPCSNFMISTMYFLILEDGDIINYYHNYNYNHPKHRRQSHRRFQDMVAVSRRHATIYEVKRHNRLQAGEQREGDDRFVVDMFHRIMSVRMDELTRVTFKLRPNRTPESCRLLRRFLVDATLAGVCTSLVLLVLVLSLVMWYCFRTQRYFDDYPGCSPELQELYNQRDHHHHHHHEMHDWLLHLRAHQLVALLFDALESSLLWFECGFVTIMMNPMILLLTRDLFIYWRYLDDKVALVLEETRARYEHAAQHNNASLLRSSGAATPRDPTRDKILHELRMEWQDFIKQIKQADVLIGDVISIYLVGWFSSFIIFIYYSMQSKTSRGSSTLVSSAILAFLVAVVITMCIGMLALHRRCRTSYTKFCSLVAYVSFNHKRNLVQVLDYFETKRTCFTMFRRQRMTPTTFLAIIGWTISCYFVLLNLDRY